MDFQTIHDTARSKSVLSEGAAVGQYGAYDFQRNSGNGEQQNNVFYSAYTDASNYAVGVYLHGLGLGRATTALQARLYAAKHSSNAGNPRQESMWLKGWDDAEAGSLAKQKKQ